MKQPECKHHRDNAALKIIISRQSKKIEKAKGFLKEAIKVSCSCGNEYIDGVLTPYTCPTCEALNVLLSNKI